MDLSVFEQWIPWALAIVGLGFAGLQLRASRKIARGEFLLGLDEMFEMHHKVHRRLRPGGDWSDSGEGPTTADDWIAVERYMGLFERIQMLIEDNTISLKTIDRLYGYRLINIIDNKHIHEAKLVREKAGWQDFINLRDAILSRRGQEI